MANRRGSVEDSNGVCKGVRPYEALYNALVGRCKRLHREVMPFGEFITFTAITTCHYCTGPVHWARRMIHGRGYSHGYNLDRLDSSKGYLAENCVVCCGACNRMKWVLGYDEFRAKILFLAGRIQRGEL
jgi:hypothetical protein